jgi:hypothetical protein|tara:strand:+ start:1449 stop:1646 length:198 start_codon:yes stop_codon:yes gene_type:complete
MSMDMDKTTFSYEHITSVKGSRYYGMSKKQFAQALKEEHTDWDRVSEKQRLKEISEILEMVLEEV